MSLWPNRYAATPWGAVRRALRYFAIGVVLGLLAALAIGSVKAQEHPPQHMSLHDRFYSKWNKPNGGKPRENSCCNKIDCSPTPVRQQTRFGITYCEAFKRPSFEQVCDDWGGCANDTGKPIPGHWVTFDCGLLEENQPDPEESPDGLSHACIANYSDDVVCAVRGSLQ